MKPTYNDLINKISELKKIVLEQSKQIKELQNRLTIYENAHTPPSKQRFKKNPPNEPKGKVGAKNGHEKWERPQPTPIETIEHSETNCPKCNHTLGKPVKVYRKIVEDIPEPQPVQVVEHLINQYKCKCCGKIVVPKVKLPRGRFGFNLQTEIALLNVDARLALLKVRVFVCKGAFLCPNSV